ncbi:MAG: competence/damage-inducible protein A [Chloroflexi bacterium]|nr:competence/damage-inducible protein A [Chloroflexota bacterium]
MRTIQTAELLAIGSELTVGETRDTNSGELAAALTLEGVEILRMTALPDDFATVTAAVAAALERSDVVVSTGGLGPTPDDLTRESIAAAIGETPVVDPVLEAWLRGLFGRRGIPFSTINLKQAWVLPSGVPIPNENGTAPGWWVDRPDGRIVVALPGPPRELRPMWADWVVPRLRDRGLGRPSATLTLRTTGIGESLIAERLGSLLGRGANPIVATYARADAVDVRISAIDTDAATAADLVAAAEAAVLARIGDHVWARGDTSWPAAIESGLGSRGWSLATAEIGTRGSLTALLGEGLGDRLVRAVVVTESDAMAIARSDLVTVARDLRGAASADVGLAVLATSRHGDMAVTIAIADPNGEHMERRVAFLAGSMGRSRAALLTAAVLYARLR